MVSRCDVIHTQGIVRLNKMLIRTAPACLVRFDSAGNIDTGMELGEEIVPLKVGDNGALVLADELVF